MGENVSDLYERLEYLAQLCEPIPALAPLVRSMRLAMFTVDYCLPEFEYQVWANAEGILRDAQEAYREYIVTGMN